MTDFNLFGKPQWFMDRPNSKKNTGNADTRPVSGKLGSGRKKPLFYSDNKFIRANFYPNGEIFVFVHPVSGK